MPAAVDLTGKRFGSLVATALCGSRNGKRRWICQCDCGATTEVSCGNLRTGKVKSCGCSKLAVNQPAKMTHGMNCRGARASEYSIWSSMRQRCENPRSQKFADYGGRGIRVCESWTASFEAFYRDMGPRPAGMTLDRIDNNGNYEPRNCRWASRDVQSRNKRNNLLITLRGRTLPLVDWCSELGLPYTKTLKRLRRGWTPEKAFT